MTPVEVHHVVTGPAGAPVVVLSNSLGTTHAMWNPQAEPLAEHFRVVRYDTRGHGESPVPPGPYRIEDVGADLLALLDRLEVERAHIVGLSVGGMTAMWTATTAPERVDKLVLLCTSAQLGPAEGWAKRAALVREQGMKAVAAGSLERWLTAGFRTEHPEVAADLEAMISAIDPEGYAGLCGVIETLDLREQLRTITAPALVIAGEQDPATPPEHGELIAAGIPHSRFEVLDPAAHLANVERQSAVTDLILEHLGA